MAGVFSPGRAKIDVKTLRTDRWWLQPTITVAVLVLFIIYATFRAFEGDIIVTGKQIGRAHV